MTVYVYILADLTVIRHTIKIQQTLFKAIQSNKKRY